MTPVLTLLESLLAATGESLRIGPPELLFRSNPDPARTWPADHPIATLREGGKTLFFYNHPQPYHNPVFSKGVPNLFEIRSGNSGSPRDSLIEYPLTHRCHPPWHQPPRWSHPTPFRSSGKNSIRCDENSPGGFQMVWLMNIHQFIPARADDPLLGFLHIETLVPGGRGYPARYSIGLAASRDRGRTWAFLGEIIRPYINGPNQSRPVHDPAYNVGGVPYLIVSEGGQEWIYVYFNEFLDPDGVSSNGNGHRQGVARAPLQSVRLAARDSGAVSGLFHKYAGKGEWGLQAMEGRGPGGDVFPGDAWMDFHSDAVECVELDSRQFLLTAVESPASDGKGKVIALYRSQNGLDWGNRMVLAEVSEAGNTVGFPGFVSDNPPGEDGLRMGDSFHLLYPEFVRQHSGVDGIWEYSYFRKKISVIPGNRNFRKRAKSLP